MRFASDNSGPAAPEIIEAIGRANQGYAASYGGDSLTARVQEKIREVFEAPGAAVHLVATGTAANALALACLCPPWATVYCHDHSHVQADECGAPEFYTGGAKLTPLPGPHGKIAPSALREALEGSASLGVHNVQNGPLSLTNTTDLGAVYSVAEVTELCEMAKTHGVGVHMDGARFANAIVQQGCSPAEMTWKAGVDILCFGGTKNGLMDVEAVVLFDPGLAWEFELRRKRGGHLLSKHRFLAAQMDAYLNDGLWLRLAGQANRMAARLARGLETAPGGRLEHPADANMVFAGLPRASHARARGAGAEYHFWPVDQNPEGAGEEVLTARMVCNWATTEAEVDRFLELVS
ncbi:MAG: threonine aldolase family protein [Paracoccaceae bacterium]